MEHKQEHQQQSTLSTPMAIIVAGVVVAGAIIFVSAGNSNEGNTQKPEEVVRGVQQNDHIYGNPEASISLIEFSDFECPYCARVHPTLKEIVDESDGEVNWVYRHFPLSGGHPNAVAAAVASECVAKLAGNDAFWEFTEHLFENQRALGADFFIETAENIDVPRSSFTTCFETPGDEIIGRIQGDLDEVRRAGGSGTPYTVVKNEDGEEFPVPGAVSKQQFLGVIERAQGQ